MLSPTGHITPESYCSRMQDAVEALCDAGAEPSLVKNNKGELLFVFILYSIYLYYTIILILLTSLYHTNIYRSRTIRSSENSKNISDYKNV